jgi:hypothetical protein
MASICNVEAVILILPKENLRIAIHVPQGDLEVQSLSTGYITSDMLIRPKIIPFGEI